MTPPVETSARTLDSGASAQIQPALRRKSALREYAEALLVALALAFFVRTFILQAYMIPSGSMEPTLLIGDHILVSKIAYGIRIPDSIFGLRIPGIPYGRYLVRFGTIHRGDVVVFVPPQDRDKDFIKRVIGVPGDRIQIKDGRVWLNGRPMDDPHAHLEVPASRRSPDFPRDNFGFIDATGSIVGPLEVPPGKLFVMGDNRDHSDDSRYWGFADQTDVEGKAIAIYWSWDGSGVGLLPIRWSRFGTLLTR